MILSGAVAPLRDCSFSLYPESHVIVAWFQRGFADERKTNKKQAQDILC